MKNKNAAVNKPKQELKDEGKVSSNITNMTECETNICQWQAKLFAS